jgi:chemotaxis signal transduction protein
VKLPRQIRKTHRAQGYAVVLFTVGDCTFAIGASAVNEIQGLQELEPIGAELRVARFGKVRHTLLREGRRYWVVDSNIHFHVTETTSTRVLLLADSPVALKVDGIVRMAEIARIIPLPQSFCGEERNWYMGLALVDGNVVPVLNPNAFLTHFDMTALEAAIPPPIVDGDMAGALV